MGADEWTMTSALAGSDFRPRLGEHRMPTLILRGAHDLSTDAIAKTLADGIPHAHKIVFAESSRTPVLEETGRVPHPQGLYGVEAREDSDLLGGGPTL